MRVVEDWGWRVGGTDKVRGKKIIQTMLYKLPKKDTLTGQLTCTEALMVMPSLCTYICTAKLQNNIA